MADDTRTDDVTGYETTGHEWDGIEELNRPLPKWWLYVFYATIIWSIIYYILYPAIPMMNDFTRGLLGHTQRSEVAMQLVLARESQMEWRNQIEARELDEIVADPELLRFALAGGKAAFGDNCAPCHGSGAQGFKGYPNLNDDAWIWGGSLESIHTTLLYGIRADHDDTRLNDMLAFGRDGILDRGQVNDVTEYVLSISGQDHVGDAAARGETVFADNCVACHGEGGVGNQELGAPNLTDAIWLYGGDRETIHSSVHGGRGGVMPAWVNRLDLATIKQLAVFVHSLGGGE